MLAAGPRYPNFSVLSAMSSLKAEPANKRRVGRYLVPQLADVAEGADRAQRLRRAFAAT
jgi:hypothetical protein